MKDIYLTPELKAIYMKDFNENVLNCENESWKLDEGIIDFLIRINSNPHIQSLYSRRHQLSSMDTRHESYLHFAYSKDVEDQLFKIFLPEVTSAFCYDEEIRSYYTFSYPEESVGDPHHHISIGYFRMDNYENVDHIRLHMRCYKGDEHERFWQEITKRLEGLNPY